jgi:hypothetical protein
MEREKRENSDASADIPPHEHRLHTFIIDALRERAPIPVDLVGKIRHSLREIDTPQPPTDSSVEGYAILPEQDPTSENI